MKAMKVIAALGIAVGPFFKSLMKTHVYVAAALVIKKRALERLRKAHSPVCWFKADDALSGLFELALIFRALLNETQAQSSTGTGTRNIPELGI